MRSIMKKFFLCQFLIFYGAQASSDFEDYNLDNDHVLGYFDEYDLNDMICPSTPLSRILDVANVSCFAFQEFTCLQERAAHFLDECAVSVFLFIMAITHNE